MKAAHDETTDLLDTLLFTVELIATSGPQDKQGLCGHFYINTR